MSFRFDAHKTPHRWLARRYQPIINRESAYAVLWNTTDGEWQLCVRWWERRDQNIGWAAPRSQAEREATRGLVTSVNQLKRTHSGQEGGGFRINEFGQAIVPTGAGGAASAFCAGVATGALRFKHPDGGTFDLTSDGASPGDDWTRPVVALRYTIHQNDTPSFEHSPDSHTRERIRLQSPQAIGPVARSVRGQDVFALLVNDQGEAVVKCPPDWQARYVGRIDLANWFEEETCD